MRFCGKRGRVHKSFVWRCLPFNPLTAEWALRVLTDFTLSDARRFYSSMGNPLDGKGLNFTQDKMQPREQIQLQKHFIYCRQLFFRTNQRYLHLSHHYSHPPFARITIHTNRYIAVSWSVFLHENLSLKTRNFKFANRRKILSFETQNFKIRNSKFWICKLRLILLSFETRNFVFLLVCLQRGGGPQDLCCLIFIWSCLKDRWGSPPRLVTRSARYSKSVSRGRIFACRRLKVCT